MGKPRAPIPSVRTFNCPKCSGPVTLRAPGRSMSVACSQCRSILDISTPEVQLLETYKEKLSITPQIPLGSRGKLKDVEYEVIGFMRRGGEVDGESFAWDEYLLYNPYHGYRFLAETSSGWQTTRMTNAVPGPPDFYGDRMLVERKPFNRSETYQAHVKFVVGEFYWRVSVGETVMCYDYGGYPHLLMCEVSDEEYIWSIGETISWRRIWTAFKVPGRREKRFYSASTGDSGDSKGCLIAIIVIVVLVILIYIYIKANEGGGGSYHGGYHHYGGSRSFFGGK